MKTPVAFVLIALSLCSCRGKSSKTVEPSVMSDAYVTTPSHIIDDEFVSIALSRDNAVDYSDIVAETEVIRLDSRLGLIGKVKKTEITDSHIVISDENSVFVFDRNGSGTARIRRPGRGPQDYVELTHMTLTPDNKIAIFDQYGQKILYYSLEGEYLSSESTKFLFLSMEYAAPDEIVCVTLGQGDRDSRLNGYRGNKSLVFFANDKLMIKRGVMPFMRDRKIFSFVFPVIHKFGGRVYINPVFSDTIYVARNNTLAARYHIDMKKIGGEANFADRITNEEFDALPKRAALFHGTFVDSDNHLLIGVGTPPETYINYYIYSKKTGGNYWIGQGGAKADEVINSYIKSATTSHKDRLVSVVDAYMIASLPDQFKNMIPELAGMEIKEEDNPIVVFYTLKDNL